WISCNCRISDIVLENVQRESTGTRRDEVEEVRVGERLKPLPPVQLVQNMGGVPGDDELVEQGGVHGSSLSASLMT
ncbi:MAG: hypothetical protein SGPRY_001384, partial [Prymnesium sp.]